MMKIYTRDEGRAMRNRNGNFFLLGTVLIAVVIIVSMETFKISMLGWVLMALMTGAFLFFTLRIIDSLQFFGPAFIVDSEQKVLGYFSECGYVRKEDLKNRRAEVISHEIQVVERQKQLQIIVNNQIVTINARARIMGDPTEAQRYFDAFVKSSGKGLDQGRMLDNLLAVFLRQNEAKIPGLYIGETKTVAEAEYFLGIKLSAYLRGELLSSGMLCHTSMCTISCNTSILS